MTVHAVSTTAHAVRVIADSIRLRSQNSLRAQRAFKQSFVEDKAIRLERMKKLWLEIYSKLLEFSGDKFNTSDTTNALVVSTDAHDARTTVHDMIVAHAVSTRK